MTATPRGPETARPGGRLWNRGLVISVAGVLAIPVVLGAGLGLFQINPVEAEMLSSAGLDAHLLLDSFPDNDLIVEIAYQTSAGPPPPSAVATLLDRINETCQKGSVTVDEHSFVDQKSSFSEADLLHLDQVERRHWPVPGTMSLFYLYLGGSYSPVGGVIGAAFRASSIAVFEGTIASSLFSSSTPVITTVMVHEFGHELGLVGIVGNAPNEDPAHPDHSTDPNDVMYWQVDSTQIAGLGSSPPTQFDAADLNDLKTVRATIIPTEVLPWAVLAGCLLFAVLLVRREARRRRAARSGASAGR